MPFGTLREFAWPLGKGGPDGQRGVAEKASEPFRSVRSDSEETGGVFESVEQEEEILVQRLSDLEARSIQTQPELFANPIGACVMTPNSSVAPAHLPIPVELPATFVTYGEL